MEVIFFHFKSQTKENGWYLMSWRPPTNTTRSQKAHVQNINNDTVNNNNEAADKKKLQLHLPAVLNWVSVVRQLAWMQKTKQKKKTSQRGNTRLMKEVLKQPSKKTNNRQNNHFN